MRLQRGTIKHFIMLTMVILFTSRIGLNISKIYARSYLSDVIERNQDSDTPITWSKERLGRMYECTQPDGVKVLFEVVLGGLYNTDPLGLLRKDGYTAIYDKETGFTCWARQGIDGNLESTGYPVHLYDPEQLGLEKNIRQSKEQAEKKVRHFMNTGKLGDVSGTTYRYAKDTTSLCPSTGTINSLVIYIYFNALGGASSLSSADSTAIMERFSELTAYYHTVSYGSLTIIPHLKVVTYNGSIESILPRDDISNPNGYSSESEKLINEFSLVLSFLNGFNSGVSGLDSGTSPDGFIDNVTVILGGSFCNPYSEPLGHRSGYTQTQWTNMANDSKPKISGLYVDNIIVHYKNILVDYNWSLSVLAHEFGHALGIDEMYTNHSTVQPVGIWDIMYALDPVNSYPPPSMTAYLKYKYTEWMGFNGTSDIPQILNSGTYTVKPLMSSSLTSGEYAYKFLSPFPDVTEYIIIENRKKTTAPSIESKIPSSGLLIYRVNESSTGNANGSISAGKGTPFELYLYRPDGYYISVDDTTRELQNGNINNAAFPGNGKTAFNDYSNPGAFFSNGKPMGFSIENIRSSSSDPESISFDFLIEPDLTFPLMSYYTLQDGINWIEHGGAIRYDYDVVYDWYLGWYQTNTHEIDLPINLYGKSLTFESYQGLIPNQLLYFYDVFNIKDTYGTITLNNIKFNFSHQPFQTALNIECSDIVLNNAIINLNMGISKFTGNPGAHNTITFGPNSEIRVNNLSSLYITDYEYEDSKIVVGPLASLYKNGQRIRSGFSDEEEYFPGVIEFDSQNYPNPFNPETTISFTLPKGSHVSIEIFNVKGQKIKSLVHDIFLNGSHRVVWNGTNDDNQAVGSGVYFYRIKTNENTVTKKMILIK